MPRAKKAKLKWPWVSLSKPKRSRKKWSEEMKTWKGESNNWGQNVAVRYGMSTKCWDGLATCGLKLHLDFPQLAGFRNHSGVQLQSAADEFCLVESILLSQVCFSDANTGILASVYPCRYKKSCIHLWPVYVMRVKRATASLRPVIPILSVYVWTGRRNTLRAVIQGGLFQTMPLYWSPFILAAGCLRAAGALWQILKEGSLPPAILYEENTIGATTLLS